MATGGAREAAVACGSLLNGCLMRAVVQRVSGARVRIAGETAGEIGRGLLVLLGIAKDDTAEQAHWLAEKIVDATP